MVDQPAVLKEALKVLRKHETFEKSLGRAVRRYGGNYEDYIALMSEVRDRANRKGIDLLEAAKELSKN